MKKCIVTLLLLIAGGGMYALPIGNPSEASLFLEGVWWESYRWDAYDPCFSWCEAWSLRCGFAGDYVFNRYMKVDGDHTGKDMQTTTLFTNAGYLALNFCDQLDIFGRIGETNIHLRTNAASWGSTSSLESELSFESFLSWSAGARFTVWECGGFALGIEGEYFQTAPDVEYFLNYSDGSLTYFNDHADAFYSEWQIGTGISYRLVTTSTSVAFIPYAALTWSRSKLVLHDLTFPIISPSGETLILYDLKAIKLWGYAIGMTCTLSDQIGVTIEGRFASEKALYVNAEARF